MEQIRVKRGIEVGVNDNGDSILIDTENTLFTEKYIALMDNVQAIADSIDTSVEVTDAEASKIITGKMREVMTEIDKLFGEDACKKIFGEDVVPSPYSIADFFVQMLPIVDKHCKQREKLIADRYQPRKGGHR